MNGNLAVRGSIALNMVSSCSQGNSVGHAGSTYQNTVQNLLVQNADVGIYMGPLVNANQVTNVNMYGSAYIRKLKHGFPVHKLGS